MDKVQLSDTVEPSVTIVGVVNRLMRINAELLDTIECLQSIMPCGSCGHPLVCATSGPDKGIWHCRWCEEVARARALSNMKAASRAGRMPR